MEYVDAVDAVRRRLESRGDLLGVQHGVELVLVGWRLHADAGWDQLGVVAQEVAEDLHHLPPVAFTLTEAGNPAEAWQATVGLAQAVANRLDDVAAEAGAESSRSWWAATSAARLRAAAGRAV